ncbi:MAG: polyprenyl synthetase family protein [Bacteroidales bacterium]|nr:polyprenyl synthetase family protein [Bacteroidales bacterium]
MSTLLSSDVQLLDQVNASVLQGGGKMIRPMLALLAAGACGRRDDEEAVKVAAISEVLHNATLLHDDVVDGSSLRRGAPTVFSLLGGGPAVLLGDYWLSKAVDTILSTKVNPSALIRIFAQTISDLAGGELLQMEKAGTCDTTEDDYLRIIHCKTASLFEATARGVAIAVGAPEASVEALAQYGAAVGCAFQIKDDIFDYLSDESIGKPVGIDIAEKKITLPLLGALKDSPEEARIRGLMREMDSHPENAEKIREFAIDGGGVVYAEKRLSDFTEKAIEALSPLPETEEKSYLAELALYIAGRKK